MLIVVSSPIVVDHEAVLINTLFDEGMALFHLRKPNYSKVELTGLLRAIKPQYMDRIALHQHHGLAADFGIRRLHFTEEDREMMVSLNIPMSYYADNYISLSTSIHDVEDYASLDATMAYSFLGPVFNSLSKPDYMAHDKFCLPNKMDKRTKLIAIGGIDVNTIGEALSQGFDGVAALGFVWNSPNDSLANFRELQRLYLVSLINAENYGIL